MTATIDRSFPGPLLFDALERLQAGIAYYGVDGELVYANELFRRLASETQVRDAVQIARETIECAVSEGHWVRVDVAGTAEGGRICCLVDITDLKASALATDAARAFLDAVVENVPAPIVVKDGPTGRFLILNRAGEEMLGVERKDHLGKTGYDIYPAAQADLFAAEDREVLQSGTPKVIEEEGIVTPNNGLRILRTQKLAIRNPLGSDYLLAISEDITERKAATEELRAAHRRAEAASLAKTRFLANMSHEIRTPLNGVAGATDVLLQTALTPEQRRLLEIVRDSASIVDGLLSDILDLAGADAPGAGTTKASFQLGALLRRKAALYSTAAAAKGLSFELDIAPEADIWVDGEPAPLRRILHTLLSNAVKFTDHGSTGLAVEACGPDRFIIHVHDTGIGFDASTQAQIFEPFTQADSSETRRHGGAGLGLAIALRCASELGAKLECRSEPGIGSRFSLTVSLPASRDADRATATGDPDAPGRDDANVVSEESGGLYVLIVDDNATNRLVLELILAQVGGRTMSVENGLEAVKICHDHTFDLILMDIQMPVMDGLTATREIRSQEAALMREQTPIIIVSANGSPECVEAGVAAGAQAHLHKPISAQALIDTISVVLDAGEQTAVAAGARSS